MPYSKLSSSIKRVANSWASQLVTLTRYFAPRHIAPYVKSQVEQRGEGTYSINLYVNLRANPQEKYGSKDARAQEYGSGERAETGGTFIPIFPKKGKFLAFKWDVADANPEKFRFLPDGRVLLPAVKSPGIYPYERRGYMRPAIEEISIKGRSELEENVRQAVIDDIYMSFKGVPKR